ARSCTHMPGAVAHQITVAKKQMIRSTQMPAMMVYKRALRSPMIQIWVTSQTKVGAKYISRNSIFSTLPPKFLHVIPCADSWQKAITPNRNQNSTRSHTLFSVKL